MVEKMKGPAEREAIPRELLEKKVKIERPKIETKPEVRIVKESSKIKEVVKKFMHPAAAYLAAGKACRWEDLDFKALEKEVV